MSQLVFDKVVLRSYKPIGTLLLLVGCTVSSHAATYRIEPDNSNIRFAIDHLKTSVTTCGFYNVTGLLRYDPSAKTGDISLVIPTKNLNAIYSD